MRVLLPVPASLVLAAALAAAAAGIAAPAHAAGAGSAPYIVVLKQDVAHPGAVADEHRRRHGAQIRFTYGAALKGYAAQLTPHGYAEVVRDRRVAYVEPDGVVRVAETQLGATWGLDRIDDRTGLDGSYASTATGAGVTAYVIDTGIRADHVDFGGRVVGGVTSIDDGRGTGDCNGHGTHVAGTIGGATYGVAKAVTLVPVRVLGCDGSGTWSGVIAGVDWVTAQTPRPAVANMSLGGGASSAVDDAVASSIAAGVSYAVAAGNGNSAGRAQDACNYSPARVPAAMTISATSSTDAKISWANYGSCVDWFAPGASITSAWHSSSTATNTISGTSMATPHAAGAAALHLEGDPTASPATVRDALLARTTKCVVSSAKTANNHLLYSLTETDLRTCTSSGSGGGPKKR